MEKLKNFYIILNDRVIIFNISVKKNYAHLQSLKIVKFLFKNFIIFILGFHKTL